MNTLNNKEETLLTTFALDDQRKHAHCRHHRRRSVWTVGKSSRGRCRPWAKASCFTKLIHQNGGCNENSILPEAAKIAVTATPCSCSTPVRLLPPSVRSLRDLDAAHSAGKDPAPRQRKASEFAHQTFTTYAIPARCWKTKHLVQINQHFYGCLPHLRTQDMEVRPNQQTADFLKPTTMNSLAIFPASCRSKVQTCPEGATCLQALVYHKPFGKNEACRTHSK